MPVPKVGHFQQQTPRVSAQQTHRRSLPKVEPRTRPDFAQQEKQHSDNAAEVASQAMMGPDGNGDGQNLPFSGSASKSMIGDLNISSSPSTRNVPALQIYDSPVFDDYGCQVPMVESPDLASVQSTARGIAAYDISGMEVPPLIGHEQAAAYLSPGNFSRANLTGCKDVTSFSPYSQVSPPQCSYVRAVLRAFLCEFSKTATSL